MGVRSFVDSEGNRWQVWQVVPNQSLAPVYTREMGKGWLCFECASEKRRLPNPPSGWSEWPDEALERLRLAAEPAPRPLPSMTM